MGKITDLASLAGKTPAELKKMILDNLRRDTDRVPKALTEDKLNPELLDRDTLVVVLAWLGFDPEVEEIKYGETERLATAVRDEIKSLMTRAMPC